MLYKDDSNIMHVIFTRFDTFSLCVLDKEYLQLLIQLQFTITIINSEQYVSNLKLTII